jgi:hypothetical protein
MRRAIGESTGSSLGDAQENLKYCEFEPLNYDNRLGFRTEE